MDSKAIRSGGNFSYRALTKVMYPDTIDTLPYPTPLRPTSQAYTTPPHS